MSKFTQTFTLTFGDQGENHVGMQKIGEMSKKGFNYVDIMKIKSDLAEKGVKCEIYHLNKLLSGKTRAKSEDAYILVARNAVNVLLDYDCNANDLYEEQNGLEKDTKAYMYGRVVNKKARYNLCFSEEGQEPDYEDKKGRIISYQDVPLMSNLRNNLIEMVGKKGKNLVVEGNYYFNLKNCYIGFHGDSERRKVIGVRLGASFKLHFQWYDVMKYDEKETKKAKLKNKDARDRKTKEKLGKRLEIVLNHGDLYVMSEKAVGTDWKSSNTITLRHAAGEASEIELNKEFTNGKEILGRDYSKYARDKEGYIIIDFV